MKNASILTKAFLVMVLLLFFGAQAFAQPGSSWKNAIKIDNVDDFLDIEMDKFYILEADIDLSGQDCYTKAVFAYDEQPGYVFEGTPFTGGLDGDGHVITGLCIDASAFSLGSFLGLFGKVQGDILNPDRGTIRNLGLEDVSITGANACGYIGALAGENDDNSTINNCWSSGTVSKGGLSYNSGGDIGGLVGRGRNISNCWSTCTVSAGDYSDGVGGLAGHGSYITCSYAAGDVSIGNDSQAVGGLAGYSSDIICCYATGNVTAGDSVTWVGGLVGDTGGQFGILDSYATGTVTGGINSAAGGLVGYTFLTPITNCYSTGFVDCPPTGGGLIADNLSSPVTSSFWDIETSGWTTSEGGIGLTTAQMQTESTFTDAGWDFEDIWFLIEEGETYPMLFCQPEAECTALHVSSIDMELSNAPKRLKKAEATITILNCSGQPVSQVAVWGQWSGQASDSDSGTTDIYGQVVFTSDPGTSGTFTITVTDVSKTGYTYDPEDNVETSDSISY